MSSILNARFVSSTLLEIRMHSMRGILSLILASGLLAVHSTAATAQTSIRELKQQRGTTISGTITNIVGNEFVLNDGTGQVIVDAGPHWHHQINLKQGERVTVTGEYDDDDFDAFQITRRNGTVIRIRDGAGRPPWAGRDR